MLLKTRSGKTTSLQFGNWGKISGLDKEDFFLPTGAPFLINNESDEDVFLDVYNAENVLIENTRFRPGYDPRHVFRIKKKIGLSSSVSLNWGN